MKKKEVRPATATNQSYEAMIASDSSNQLGLAATSGTSSTKHIIGFGNIKSNPKPALLGDRKTGLKLGGPIRATGAAIEHMESFVLPTNQQQMSSTLKNITQPGLLFDIKPSLNEIDPNDPNGVASKMPQRPGSSKPVQKGSTRKLLSDEEESHNSKRPESAKPSKSK